MSKIISYDKAKKLKNEVSTVKVKEVGNINISVMVENETKIPFYYIQPDCEELLPIVDIIDVMLTNSYIRIQGE